MTGIVYLGCGRGAADEALLWHEMPRSNPRVLYWPFALTGRMLAGAHDWLSRSLNQLGERVDLSTWASLDGRDPSDLMSFDLLFVGGGNTFRLLHHIRKHGFVQPVRDSVASGVCYYGGSAGAVLACDDIAIARGHDPNLEKLEDLDGLRLVSEMAILPHYDDSQKTHAQTFSSQHETPVVPIPDGSGVVAFDGEMRSVGRDDVTIFGCAGQSSAMSRRKRT
ncbi:dipeptidase E [Nakamurella sp. UYEF19]|uniref:Type 1 glutamine amidotransferase-like domain-containing protein n=1 Tax=Nakamurella sp. UYEF19 TaxID=1756392 RepID=UPI0033945007